MRGRERVPDLHPDLDDFSGVIGPRASRWRKVRLRLIH